MAGKNAQTDKDKGKEEVKGQGRAVVLPNGERRIDYIRNGYYNAKTGLHGEAQKSRVDIKNAINDMLKKAGPEFGEIMYQIVFSATKTDKDPRVTAKEKLAASAKAGDDKGAETK
ncbi:hypothetical protein LCGC14_0481540 [marine sediment metagenome]|uniref:Uncharacterized protein n=1 Tax=marine sediment metagenome TaxID=412755 RepID=A0A0F9SEH3_9ZZZZ